MSHPRLFTSSYCCILTANFLLYFGFWLLIPILPFYLKENYQLQESAIGLILSCYTISALTVRPFSSYLLDTFSRKPLYLIAYGVFTVLFLGYMSGGVLLMFVALRIAHGLAFGTVTVGGNTLVVDIMPSERRGEGLGYYGLANNIALSLGPMTGLFLHNVLSYPSIFVIAFGSCLLGFILALQIKTTVKPRIKRPALSLDRFILIKGIPASIALLLLSIPYGATTNFVAMYVEQIHLNVIPGFFFVLLAAGLGLARIFAGRYVDRGFVTECIHYGFYLVISAFLLLGLCAYIVKWNTAWAIGCFHLVPFIQGIGFGIMFPAYNSLYINLAPNNQRATATGTYLTSWDVGIGLGIVGSGIIAEIFSFSIVYFIGAFLSLMSMAYFKFIVTPHYKRNKIDT